MIFSIDSIKNKPNRSLSVTPETFIDFENKSFFIEALQYLSEESKTFDYCFESVLNEGVGKNIIKILFTKIDYKKIIKKIIDNFISLLEKIWNNFYAFLMNFFSKNDIIKHNKSALENIKDPIYFSETRFIYTNLGLNTSYTSFKNELEKEFTDLLLDMSTFTQYTTYEQFFLKIEDIKNKIDMSENYYENLRGKIVGSTNIVKKEDFASALFKYFRNSGIEIGEGNITSAEIRACSEQYFDYKKSVKQIQKDKKDLTDASKKLQNDIMGINLDKYTSINIPVEAQKVFVKVLENKSRRVQETCKIYIQVFSAKLDAIKDSYCQNQKILFEACKSLAREGKL